MVEINLLNWREKVRIITNTRFYVIAGVVTTICMVLTFMVYGVIDGMIASQQEDISYIDTQMLSVNDKIKELKDLQAQKSLLIERQKIIETLQDSRPFVVRLFDSIVRVVPDGVVLDQITRRENVLTLKGTSDSNATIAKMMSNVQQLKWVKEANLGELKSGKSDNTTPSSGTAAGANRQGAAQQSAEPKNDASRIGFELTISIDTKQEGG